MADRKLADLTDDEFQAVVQSRRIARMAAIDAMSPEHRELVRDYGYNVVRACMDCGVPKARQIRHIVETVLDEFSPTRGTGSAQGVRPLR